MVIHTDATLALYCSHCGKIHTHDISRFAIKANRQVELSCKCGHIEASIAVAGGAQFFLTIYCELCRKEHVLCIGYRRSDLAEIRKLYCPKNNLELGFVGRRPLIEQLLEQHRSAVNRVLPDQSNLENDNSQILLDILNRVHDIAETGGVTCNCGCAIIRAEVLPAGIEVRCQNCGANAAFSARNEADLMCFESVKLIKLSLPCHSRQTH